jgi:hypothetical protein
MLKCKGYSTFVDADDKNCLAELTVALKYNQGVRQWLVPIAIVIIAGVFFFRSFFCAIKRKKSIFTAILFLSVLYFFS